MGWGWCLIARAWGPRRHISVSDLQRRGVAGWSKAECSCHVTSIYIHVSRTRALSFWRHANLHSHYLTLIREHDLHMEVVHVGSAHAPWMKLNWRSSERIRMKMVPGVWSVLFTCLTVKLDYGILWDEHDFPMSFLIRAYIVMYWCFVLTWLLPRVELGIPRSEDVEISCRMKVIHKSQGDWCCTTKCCCAEPGFTVLDVLFFGFIRLYCHFCMFLSCQSAECFPSSIPSIEGVDGCPRNILMLNLVDSRDSRNVISVQAFWYLLISSHIIRFIPFHINLRSFHIYYY